MVIYQSYPTFIRLVTNRAFLESDSTSLCFFLKYWPLIKPVPEYLISYLFLNFFLLLVTLEAVQTEWKSLTIELFHVTVREVFYTYCPSSLHIAIHLSPTFQEWLGRAEAELSELARVSEGCVERRSLVNSMTSYKRQKTHKE